MIRFGAHRRAIAGIAALGFVLAALGPCLCLLAAQPCHRDAETAETAGHACCEEPVGVQAVADECCGADAELVVAATDVPEVSPPTLRTGPLAPGFSAETTAADAFRTPPPLSPHRTTVLLI